MQLRRKRYFVLWGLYLFVFHLVFIRKGCCQRSTMNILTRNRYDLSRRVNSTHSFDLLNLSITSSPLRFIIPSRRPAFRSKPNIRSSRVNLSRSSGVYGLFCSFSVVVACLPLSTRVLRNAAYHNRDNITWKIIWKSQTCVPSGRKILRFSILMSRLLFSRSFSVCFIVAWSA